MAAPARILSLNLGMQTIGLAEFRTSEKGGLVLQGFRLTELIADPGVDASRVAQSGIAIQEMLGALKIKKGCKVNWALSAQSVFTRFVKLPSVAEEKVDQIITFEAQQNVPFPIDEVVWDYQLVSGEEQSKIEVVLVAIKSDLLDELSSVVDDAGVITSVVDVAPMALYNAFRYNYSEVGGCSLLIDIGARTTNLIFVENKKVFSRSIPIGGTTISAAIAKDLGEPFALAEERKKRDGFVGLGGAYAEPSDPEIARVSKMIRNTMTRLHSEISRSIGFYRSQQGGAAPTQVYLCGGGASFPYMREFFHEKLQVPVEFFNPLRNVAVSSTVNMEEAGRSAHVLGELVGLALRNVSECPMELNLQPASVVRAQKAARRKPYMVAAGFCLVLALLGWWLYFLRAAALEAAVLERLTPEVQSLQGVERQFQSVRKDVATAQAAVAPYLKAVKDRQYWVGLLNELNARLPESSIWITQMESGWVAGDGKFSTVAIAGGSAPVVAGKPKEAAKPVLRLKGLYIESPAVIDAYLKNLAESEWFIIDLSKRNEVNPVRSTPTATEWAHEYELRLPLKEQIREQ